MNRTALTLAEQLQIHDVEIRRRKELFGFTQQDEVLLSACRDFILQDIDGIVDAFYRKQTEVSEIELIIGDAETLGRLRQSQRRYVLDLFEGFYDDEYVNSRLRIGLVHKRIGVEPKYYLAAVKFLQTVLNEAICKRLEDAKLSARTCEALDRLLLFDTALVFDTYIRSLVGEIEAAKNHAVSYATSLEEKVAARTRDLAELSLKDPLTGLYNRRAMRDMLRREIARARRDEHALSVLYLDLDGFKAINDAQGHHKGDEMLRAVALAIGETIRETDTAFRCGGDEFCILLPGSLKDQGLHMAQRLIERCAGLSSPVSVSVGVAQTGPQEFDDADGLLRRADLAMYSAKGAGGGRIMQ